jgi:hypothetical protein
VWLHSWNPKGVLSSTTRGPTSRTRGRRRGVPNFLISARLGFVLSVVYSQIICSSPRCYAAHQHIDVLDMLVLMFFPPPSLDVCLTLIFISILTTCLIKKS